ncbi:DUF4373 domain-containing protein [Aliarcobacter cryaerophilus]|uniref:DUF4373 domain-containing protein n=1 Tax=Aliarcobacter cryaerophilus TaxID=28198 RepID=UPI0021B45EF3|nr:DUF4373 domain-containing protein [Aliarcobacter cryaerophilus]MCT7433765.1 DUF4373 domain-containing protein [Aliarcobacter cryaerophilus]
MSQKVDSCYFSHDANAKDDFKIMLLIEEMGLEGYGIFWVLIETLREQQGYKYPIRLLSVIARKYNTTLAKVEAVVARYQLFVIEDDCFFYSKSLIRRMQPLERAREQRVIAGKISAAKKQIKIENQISQLKIDLSASDSIQRPLNECLTVVQQSKVKKIKEIKEINKDDEEEAEKWRKWNENEVRKDMRISKLEDLSSANRDTQIIE